MEFDRRFDVIVERLVLMYYPDPVAAIRKLIRHLRPGGLMVFQEFDMDYVRSHPPAPTFERAAAWMKRTFAATGTHIRLGSDLYSVFVAAGLPSPKLRIDGLIGGGPDFPAHDLMAGAIQSILPVAERTGIVVSPALVGAWSRKSGSI
jgi:SAM-dependent methyltransferase